jgi:peroxiredoxin
MMKALNNSRLSAAMSPICIALLLLSNGFLLWKYLQGRNVPTRNPRGADDAAVTRLMSQPLQSVNGETFILSNVKSRFIVLYVFTIGDCTLCLQELAQLNAIEPGSTEFQVFSLMSHSNADEMRQTQQNFELNFPVLADPDGKLMDSLRLPKTPWKIVVDVKRKMIVYEDLPSLTKAEREAFLSRLELIGNL